MWEKREKMDNIVIVENYEKYCFRTLEEVVKQFLGEEFYDLNDKEKYKVLRLKTVRNALFNNNAPVIDLRKDERVEDIKKNQYIVYDEETFLLSLAKNNDIVLYENKNANIFVKNLNKEEKETLEKLDDDYIIVNFCVDKLLENKMKNL